MTLQILVSKQIIKVMALSAVFESLQ